MIVATALLAGMFFGGLVAAAGFFIVYLRKDDALAWKRSIIVYYATSYGVAPMAAVCAILSVAQMIAEDEMLYAILRALAG